MISVAITLSFAGLVSMTEVQRFVPWTTNMFGLITTAILSGLLLALMSSRAAWLIGLASALSVIIFSAFWIYSTWLLVGAVFSLSDPVTSNLLIVYLFPRGMILFVVSGLSGVLTALSVQFLLPDSDPWPKD